VCCAQVYSGADVRQPYLGRWGTLLPYRRPLNVVIGPPLGLVRPEQEQTQNRCRDTAQHAQDHDANEPSEAEVDALLQRYIEMLERLVVENRDRFNCPDLTLKIL
jgi:hypothetical protein